MSMVGARSNDASCSQYTQTIITTSAIGTQCCLRFFMGASCQTEDKFPETHGKAWKGFPAALLETVPEVDSAQASALKNFPAPRDGEDIAAKAGPHICSCNLHSGNTRACQQHNHPSDQAKAGASKVPHICAACKKVCREKYQLERHMRVHSGKVAPPLIIISSTVFLGLCMWRNQNIHNFLGD
ncbi:uncharacterized protein LOC144158182 isoform X3 [Haemaphysalis longicornis]